VWRARYRTPATAFVVLSLLLQCAAGQALAIEMSSLIGAWQKATQSECSGAYPYRIEFLPSGLYSTEKSPPDSYAVWDVGTFVVAGDKVSISTANDAVVPYDASLSGGTLTFKAADGCVIAYRRV
jgi:hypothetical protein